ncbi:MAG: substrate-binding domain-containing protein [Oscillospiraceae bacterium]|nr:substrate-binding domain-containing protein [Oscillospiraceae bacterium]
MIRNAAVCVSEAHKEDIQSILYPLSKKFSEKNFRITAFNCCNDLFNATAFNEAESCVFELIPYSSCDAVIIFAQYIKNEAILHNIISGALSDGLPVVVVDGNTDYDGCINLHYDFSDAFSSLMTHLLDDHGFTKINCIAGFKDNRFSDEKVNIYKKALADHGIPFEDERFGYGNFYSTPTIEVMERFLSSELGLPEAIVCINDSMALTVCEMLMQRGIKVPEDVVVTGFDGIEQEKYNFPRLTTCRRDLESLAEHLLSVVSSALDGTFKESTSFFPYTLDRSESCGCREKSVADINKSINSLYSRLNDFQLFDNSMNNMNAKLTNELDHRKVTEIIKHYAAFNCFMCLNSDFQNNRLENHQKGGTPFTSTINADKYFYGIDSVPHSSIDLNEFIPDKDFRESRTDPLFVYAIHNQNNVTGYLCAYVPDTDFNIFSLTLHRLNKFVLGIDTCIGSFIQQSYLKASNARLRDIQNKIISSFADLVESRDDFTGQHIKRTSEYLRLLVFQLKDNPKYKDSLTREASEMMIKAAPLHDIGKIKIADSILNKPGRLTDEEFEIIKTHTIEGRDIIEKTLTNIESEEYIKIASHMALYHHEKWDGSGYPCRLSGEDIPLCARIMAVVDVFDALTSKRVYKEAFSTQLAFDILEESRGTHFDPDIAKAFIDIKPQVEQILHELQ